MKTLFCLSLALASLLSFARPTGSVIQVSRKLKMVSADPTPPKEYWIDIGQNEGVREDMLLQVFRLSPVYNTMSGGPGPLVRIYIGDLKVMAASDSGAVGRASIDRSLAEIPSAEHNGFMLGDEVQIKQSLPFP